MSSKTARPDGTTPKRPWSLAPRLAVGYGAAAFALLLVASGYSYWSLSRNLAREDINFLTEELREVEMLLGSKPDGAGALREHLKRETAAHVSAPLYIRALDERGETLAESAGMAAKLPVSLFPTPGRSADDPSDAETTSADERPFHVMSAPARIDGTPMVIHVAVDRSFEHRLLARFRRRLAAMLLVGLAACAVVGYVIAWRGLRPLGRMSSVIERVGSSTLDQRVDGARFPAELSTLADNFNAMLRRLEDAFARLSRFSADIAHELRTPIHNVRGMVEVTLADKHRPESEQRRLLEPCLEECNRLSRLIDNLLFVARAENPATQIVRRPVDVVEELTKVQEFYEAAANDAGVSLEFDHPAGGATAAGDTRAELDRDLFQQAVCNLVENALAHTPTGGRVRLAAKREDGVVRVEVSDTGAGIPAEHLPFVFDRFVRVDASRSKHTGGVGLGLALVKSIVTLHGGTAAVDSRVGEGSRFVLTFPTQSNDKSVTRV